MSGEQGKAGRAAARQPREPCARRARAECSEHLPDFWARARAAGASRSLPRGSEIFDQNLEIAAEVGCQDRIRLGVLRSAALQRGIDGGRGEGQPGIGEQHRAMGEALHKRDLLAASGDKRRSARRDTHSRLSRVATAI